MKRFRYIIFLALLVGCWLASAYAADVAPGRTWLAFKQIVEKEQTVYLADPAGWSKQAVVTGSKVAVFIQGKRFLYLQGQKLYEYYVADGSRRFICEFKEPKIALEVMSDGPDQALVAAEDELGVNWYILELSDGSVRKIAMRGGFGSKQLSSPDQSTAIAFKPGLMDFRIGLAVQQKKRVIWESPGDQMVIPEAVWSPDSKYFAFYAKKYDENYDGFYNLYLFDVAARKLKLVQDRSFTVLFSNLRMGPFAPTWSVDGKSLVFQYQLYGTVGRTGLLKYQVETGKKTLLGTSDGVNEYPSWSPDNQWIAVLTSREGNGQQVWVTDPQGEQWQRIAPAQGVTEWAQWYSSNPVKK